MRQMVANGPILTFASGAKLHNGRELVQSLLVFPGLCSWLFDAAAF
jgi:hypothetical protein